MKSPYLTTRETAERLRCSERTIKEWARHNLIPHRKLAAGTSPLLFLPSELDCWADTGCELEVVERAGGGRVVRPKPSQHEQRKAA